MNSNELRVEMIRNNLSTQKIAERIGISKSAMNRKLNGESEFTQGEIVKISHELHLSTERMCDIFFVDLVS